MTLKVTIVLREVCIVVSLVFLAAGVILALRKVAREPPWGHGTDWGYQTSAEVRTSGRGCICIASDASQSSNETTCSSESSHRKGPGQRVISFAYFDPGLRKHSDLQSPPSDLEGLMLNLRSVKEVLGSGSGWVVRLYTSLSQLGEDSCRELCGTLKESAKEMPGLLEICDVDRVPALGNVSMVYPPLWRFLPILDNQVGVALFRDLDRVVTRREGDALREWIGSRMAFHVMRDHPDHVAPMMAGMWGVKVTMMLGPLRAAMTAALRDPSAFAVLEDSGEPPGADQYILKTYFWPWAQASVLQHDSYNCLSFPKTKPFPTRRDQGGPLARGNFVGARFYLNETVEVACPTRCRPKAHPDWTLC